MNYACKFRKTSVSTFSEVIDKIFLYHENPHHKIQLANSTQIMWSLYTFQKSPSQFALDEMDLIWKLWK